jgi:1-aminocyclopropane-1-carboxylate deaminase/D-cysteine desulfhydrase-like pyridoxal-dependent ACC family enzyme
MGTKQIFLGEIDETQRAKAARKHYQEMLDAGRKPFIIGDPLYCDPAIGALGYVQAALEIHAQAEIMNIDLKHLVLPGSMGPTEAGLLWGSALLGRAFTVHAPSVEYDKVTLHGLIDDICSRISNKMGFTPSVNPIELLRVSDDFLGPGYDKVTKESLAAVAELAAAEGLFVETTYNAKVLHALKEMLKSGVIPKDEGVCLIHTGGLPALYAQHDRF